MALGIVQQKQVTDSVSFGAGSGYGPLGVNLYNSPGNALVAFLATGSDNPQANLARLAVGDDAHDWWIYAGSATVNLAGANRRVDIWIAPNARRADNSLGTNVSWGASQRYDGLLGSIVEVSGWPAFAQVDFVAVASGSGTSAALSGTATVADYMLGALLLSGTGSSLAPAVTDPTGWTALTTLGGGNTNADMSNQWLFPAYNTVAAGAVSATYSWTGTFSYAAVMIGFKQAPVAPAQPSPNWPSMKIEAAFGWKPGDLTGTMPTWTDITTRAQDESGATVLSTERGRDYELAQPSAGDSKITFDNHDSALNPVNSASPFFPNVVPEVPLRVSGVWNGRQYGVAYIYANKWPQTFPDPQYGTSEMAGSDAISIISQGQMPSALGGQILADFPYAYYPFNEFYQVPHGAQFANASRTNLKPIIGYSPAGSPALQTGLQLGMQGDSGTGIGISGLTAGVSNPQSGCGAILHDPGLPDIGTNLPFSIEFRFQSSWGTASQAGLPIQLVALSSLPTNYLAGSQVAGFVPEGLRLLVSYATGAVANTDQLTWTLVGPNGVALGSSPSSGGYITLTEAAFYDCVITITYNGTQYVVTTYLNGASLGTTNVAAVSPLEITGLIAGTAAPLGGFSNTQNFTVGQVAVYPFALPAARILAHHNTAVAADKGDTVLTRFGKLAVWSGLGVPALGTNSTAGPLMGPADQIQGSPLADALYNMSQGEGGFFFAPADATGGVWYMARTSLYNKTPKFTFGDRPDIAVSPPFGMATWSFTNQGTPTANNYFILTNAQAASVNPGDQFTIGGSGSYTVTAIGPPAFGFNNIFFSPPYSGIVANGTAVAQFFGEVPVNYGSGFDFSDTYVFNIIDVQRTASASNQYFVSDGQAQVAKFIAAGVNAQVADQSSETQYMPRGPMTVNVETYADSDAYDRANWSLFKYRQPQLRASQISFSPARNGAWIAALAVEQGDVVTVNRRPVGGAVISLNCVVQKVEHHVGPDVWDVILTLAPYSTESAVLQLDNGSFDQLGQGALGW